MCKLCDQGKPQDHDASLSDSRRDFLKASAATAVAAAGMNFLTAPPAAADPGDPGPPAGVGQPGRRYIIRGGYVMTMDPSLASSGNFAPGDVLVDGKTILDVGPNLQASGAAVIDARGRIVMPGFIDTHHHQFETVLRSFLADGVLINDQSGSASGTTTYLEFILLTFAPVYRPQDVYINELFAGLSQLDDGVTTVHDVSQIHHSPEHSDAAIQALFDTGRRAAFGYFESAGAAFIGTNPNNQYPDDALRIKPQWFSSSDQLVTMIMGGEVYLPKYEHAWNIGRQLGLQVAAHILSPFTIRPTLDLLAQGIAGDSGTLGLKDDNLFIHMTGMSNLGWQGVHDAGAQVSIAFPIEMNMRHGMPPILRMQKLGMEPSLSVDVECTLTADFFTQMRSCMNLQRMLVNQMTLDSPNGNQNLPNPLDWGLPESAVTIPGQFWPYWPTPPADLPAPLTTRDVLRYATVNGAKALRLDGKTGSLTPGKEADIIILDATALNVAPLNQVPGAVVSLMDRTNVETVIVAGKVRKWKGRLLGVDLPHLRQQIEASRDYVFAAANIPPDLAGPFGPQ
jgi:cytosine/adenosine deaminase-related metal-dependent hydrolase